jgi:hypothetical protein
LTWPGISSYRDCKIPTSKKKKASLNRNAGISGHKPDQKRDDRQKIAWFVVHDPRFGKNQKKHPYNVNFSLPRWTSVIAMIQLSLP